MPVKFGKSVAVRDRNTGKTTIQHDYMKCKSTGELIEVFNKDGTRPKLRQKVKNKSSTTRSEHQNTQRATKRTSKHAERDEQKINSILYATPRRKI